MTLCTHSVRNHLQNSKLFRLFSVCFVHLVVFTERQGPTYVNMLAKMPTDFTWEIQCHAIWLGVHSDTKSHWMNIVQIPPLLSCFYSTTATVKWTSCNRTSTSSLCLTGQQERRYSVSYYITACSWGWRYNQFPLFDRSAKETPFCVVLHHSYITACRLGVMLLGEVPWLLAGMTHLQYCALGSVVCDFHTYSMLACSNSPAIGDGICWIVFNFQLCFLS